MIVQWRRLIVPTVVLLLGIIVMAIAMILVPTLIVGTAHVADPVKRLELENSVRGVIVPSLAGTLFLVSAYMTWRQVDAAQQGVRLAQQQPALGARANVSERFVRAVDLLAAQQATARVGGVFALESIASDEPGYHRTVQEILAASAREHAPRELRPTRQRQARSSPADVRAMLRVLSRPPVGVSEVGCQSAALMRRSYDCSVCGDAPEEGGGASRADLSGIVLERLDLAHGCLDRARFRGAILDHCDLKKARWVHADLRGAVVRRTDLEDACFAWADLTDAVFRRCNLIGVELNNAQLERTRLEWCNLGATRFREWDAREISFRGCDMEGTVFAGNGGISHSDFTKVGGGPDFTGLHIDSCDFSEARLFRPTQFTQAELLRCTFKDTDFIDVEITGAWLAECRFPGAEMHVSFRDTVFRNVDFTGADFHLTWFENCYSDRSTRWPSGQDKPEPRWGVELCDDNDPRLWSRRESHSSDEWPDA